MRYADLQIFDGLFHPFTVVLCCPRAACETVKPSATRSLTLASVSNENETSDATRIKIFATAFETAFFPAKRVKNVLSVIDSNMPAWVLNLGRTISFVNPFSANWAATYARS